MLAALNHLFNCADLRAGNAVLGGRIFPAVLEVLIDLKPVNAPVFIEELDVREVHLAVSKAQVLVTGHYLVAGLGAANEEDDSRQ